MQEKVDDPISNLSMRDESTGAFGAHSSPEYTHRKPRILAGPWSQRAYTAPVQRTKTPRVLCTQQAAVMVLACCAGVLDLTRRCPRCFLAILFSDRCTVSANLAQQEELFFLKSRCWSAATPSTKAKQCFKKQNAALSSPGCERLLMRKIIN